MAAPGGKFFIQNKLHIKAPHHQNFKQLWETKWKFPATMGVYPFMFGAAKDFEGIVEEMYQRGIQEPYEWDKYAEVFFPKAEELEKIGEESEREGNLEKAAEYFFRSSAVYRIARFPAPRSPKQKEAWARCKEVVKKALKLKAEANGYPPVHEVLVPHVYGLEHEGRDIPIFHQLPASATKENPAPVIVIITGLDGYRTELAVWAEGFRRLGVAFMVVEIPGTGDCPADPKDPTSPDRLFASLIEWFRTQEGIDSKRVAVWSFSTGGYYGMRLAHTNPDDFAGVVTVGAGFHHFLDREWLDNVNHLEYPFDLADTLAYKFGYGDDVEAFKNEGSDRFSLLKDGTLDKPRCARVLMVNGTEDEIFPIDDFHVALEHGTPKEVRFVKGRKHMGEPEAFHIILPWLYKILGVKGDSYAQMATMPFKSLYP